ncbi:MAG: pyruvate formate-lyase-activating protein [Lachnospirales bacterium]
MFGYIHSIETFGTVDGPGVRLVVFTQGCPMRCLYCHNPDTWEIGKGKKVEIDEILKEYEKNKSFYRTGGITVTGGEPLVQIDFVTELFKKAKEKNIHTCLDTSGITFSENTRDKFDILIKYTDLIMLDIKHIDPSEHIKLTGQKQDNIIAFAKYLSDKNVPVWIRHVVVPNITDNEKYLYSLGRFIGSLKNVKALDVLPYHNMGVSKYEKLGMKYPLEGVLPMDKERAIECKKIILNGIRDERSA